MATPRESSLRYISNNKKFINIHIPKTGGLSRNRILGQGGGHTSIQKILEHTDVKIDEYFKFTVVRNPFDRLVSFYFYSMKGGVYKKYLKDFNEFVIGFMPTVTHIINSNMINSVKDNGFPQLVPQFNWICDKDFNNRIDYVGRFEEMDKSMKHICEKIKINFNKTPHLNKSKRGRYTEYHTKESIQIVSDFYKKDLEFFNYEY